MLPTVESIRRVTRTADGEITATSMLERFGFTGDRLTARIGDLSGGERRRFQLLRLLLTEPNVLLLDEPTNDLDIETLNVLEDFLDGWPGHAGRGLPRPVLPRAGHRLHLGAARRRPDLDAAARGGRVPRAPGRGPGRPGGARVRRARSPTPAAGRGHREGPGRQRRGARGPQDGGPARQAAGADHRPAGRAERRDRGARAGLRQARRAQRRSSTYSPRRRTRLELEWLEAAESLE